MGCCFSILEQDQNAPQNNLGSHETNCRIPPQPVEEEFVKEVLSETPISKPQQQVQILLPEAKTQLPVVQNPKVPINKTSEFEEPPLVSETCSNSESFSTVTENREDEATSKPSVRETTRNRKRSCAVDGNKIGGREQRVNSPAKIPPGPGSVRRRKPAGESSCQRLKSPSCTKTVAAGGGRSQLRPPGGANWRIPPAKGVVEQNDSVPVEESLENPHVSLECFIFL
ncbi:hypothetical protein RJT34_28889 [Clitoria ternatea]|uniref:Uncharacterized protein n=1 Tax=Clitoria ternatea TaxID=43366 RepID=A0AAN9F9G6_CLITE